jgi:protein disulfide-isomerase A1
MAKALLFVALAALACAEFTEEDDVLVLTDGTIDRALETYPYLLVEFYAPWCGHCKKLAPEYAKAAASLKARDLPVRLAKVDATENNDSATKYGVKGYPTLKWFSNKVDSEYNGGRTEDTIVNWILKKVGPAAEVVDSVEKVKQIVSSSKVVAVYFGKDGTRESENFKKAASDLEGASFVISTDSKALEEFGVSEPALVLFKIYDDKRVDYKGSWDVESVKRFVETSKKRWIMDFDDEAIEWIFQKSNPALFVFRSQSSASSYDEALFKVAPEIKDDITIVATDLSQEANKRLAEYLGVPATGQPLAFIVAFGRDGIEKYKGTEDLSYQGLKDFVLSWKRKLLAQFLKTEEIPAQSHDGHVRVLVGKNFEEVVYDTTKDVFVEFYAPWCGHCQKLAPEYEKAAEAFKDVSSVIIAKIDSTANEVKGQGIQGFPTLRFFPANNKSGIEFNGNRDAAGITEFIKSKAAVKIDESYIKTEL